MRYSVVKPFDVHEGDEVIVDVLRVKERSRHAGTRHSRIDFSLGRAVPPHAPSAPL